MTLMMYNIDRFGVESVLNSTSNTSQSNYLNYDKNSNTLTGMYNSKFMPSMTLAIYGHDGF
jgi:hypothetical protein